MKRLYLCAMLLLLCFLPLFGYTSAGSISGPPKDKASITGTVWEDTNNNGIMDVGENGKIEGVTVTAYYCAGDAVAGEPATTKNNGTYSIDNLDTEKEYYVIFGTKDNYERSPQGTDSDPNPSDGKTPCLELNTSGLVFDAGMHSTIVPRASITGTVWKDVDNYGIWDNSENQGLENILVEAYTCAGVLAGSDITDNKGEYSIPDLNTEVEYKVTFAAVTGYSFSLKDQGMDDAKDSDADPDTRTTGCFNLTPSGLVLDAGLHVTEVPKASITGTVWEDENNNGTWEKPGENNKIEGVTVTAYNCDGDAVAGSATTLNNGTYSIDNLDTEKEYYVIFGTKDNYERSPQGTDSDPNPSDGKTTCLELTTEGLVFDAGMHSTIVPKNNPQINGIVWNDLDGDGFSKGNEPRLGGWTVWLLDADKNRIISTETDNSGIEGQQGRYVFYNLTVGATYYIEFVLKPGYSFTLQYAANPNQDSDADRLTGITGPIYIKNANAEEEHIDAGVYLGTEPPGGNGKISGRLWNDTFDKDGLQDGNSNEPGIGGQIVELYLSDGTLYKSTTTESSGGTGVIGTYKFENVAIGSYYVKFYLPSGFTFTIKDADNNDQKDSDADQTSGQTDPFSVTTNAEITHIDAGAIKGDTKKGSIGDFVWDDKNCNGIQESGEGGVSEVTVKLYAHDDDTDTYMKETTTDQNGLYSFTNLEAGTYRVEFILPAAYEKFTDKNAGSDDTKDSNAGLDGFTDPVTLIEGENDMSIDAGMCEKPPEKGSIGDFVWFDCDGDGLQDHGEPGIRNVKVELYLSGGNHHNPVFLEFTKTDNHGYYIFTELLPGTYYVRFILPDDYGAFTILQADHNDEKDSDANHDGWTRAITLDEGEDNMNIDAGLLPLKNTSIGDFVWKDTDKDGIQDLGEPGIPNVMVQLYNWGSNDVLMSTITNSMGKYLFENLEPGDYYVKFILAEGFTFTKKDQTAESIDSDADPTTGKTDMITLHGQNDLTIDAGMYGSNCMPASIGDFVWNDLNQNGIQNDKEPGIADITVKLFKVGETSVHATTTTDKNGIYHFAGLQPGTFYVQFVLPAGFAFTLLNQGTNDALDSDANMTTGMTGAYELSSGETETTADAGMFKGQCMLSSIGDFVWIDANKNGIQDNCEAGLANVTVELYMCGVNTPVASTKTDCNGKYIFKNVMPNTSYAVKFYLPKGYTFTLPDQGNNDAIDSDVCPNNNGMTKFYDILPNQTNLTIDAGMYLSTTTTCNYVWRDNNNNGLKEDGEPGIKGVTIELYNCSSSSLVKTAQTDENGLYTFSDILLDSYFIKIIIPEGYKMGKSAQEGNGETVNSDFSTNGQSSCFDITEGTTTIGKPIALVVTTTGVTRGAATPTEFTLQQNYPNPFNPSTTIEFAVPEAGQYTLKIFNMLGQEVATLLDKDLSVGYHMVTFDAGSLTSGVYIYRLTGNNVVMTKKMMLNK